MPETSSRLLAAIDELETACAQAEDGLRRRDTAAVEASFAAQRRLTHEIQTTIAAAPAEEQAEVRRRILAVHAFREGQLRRLVAYRNAIAKRLSTIGRWNQYARGNGAGSAPAPSVLDRPS